jgi:DNA polymerase-1
MSRIFVLDAMNLTYRAYYVFIRRPLITSRGENSSAIYGFANTVLKIRREERPDYWALAWDGPGPTFRHERYDEYKATRKPMPEDLLAQIPAVEDMAAALGLPVLEVPGVEADDVMGTLAMQAVREGHEAVLVTSDKDMLQLIGDRIRVLNPGRGDDYSWVDRDTVVAKWGVEPSQVRDMLALMGDSIDNVPGVPGVGEKTAAELIREFGSLEGLYEDLERVSRPALRQKLGEHRDAAFLSRDLITVRTDCELPCRFDQLRRGPIRRDALLSLARRYEFKRIERIAEEEGVEDGLAGELPVSRNHERRAPAPESAERASLAEPKLAAASTPEPAPARLEAGFAPPAVPATPRPLEPPLSPPPLPRPAVPLQGALDLYTGSTATATAVDSPEVDEQVRRLHEIRARAPHGLALLPIFTGADARRATLIGLALAARDGSSCYLPLGHEGGPNLGLDPVRGWLGPVLADPRVDKIGEDLKRDSQALAGAGLPLEGLALDVHVASFLCDPERDHSLAALTRDMLGYELSALEPPPQRGRPRPGPAALPVADAITGATRAVAALFPLADMLRAQLEGRDQWRLYTTLEHPLITVLLDMEAAGVAVDVRVLVEMSAHATAEIVRLEAELYALAGERFNLNSGPQLARILFEKLGLKAGRRTKTGWSTDQAVMEELAAVHPLPARLLEYRALAKLKSTYLDAIPLEVDPADGRVHTSYHQAGAATGRLSSSRPNLQNIPMRTEQGRAIRRAFVAPPGRVLIGADYSQIELRVMAHLSGDPRLIEAFGSGEDIHASTARQVFGVGEGPLDPGLRAKAKVVNFGIMYGMGARSLSQQMGIGLEEARVFIAHYFRVFERVREFLDATIEEARRRGYVQTLLGRRRYLPSLGSVHGGERALAERAAINAPIQGSAADLMKLAMLRVHAVLKQSWPSARLLLQVHDELLLECALDEADEVADAVRGAMEGCFPLRVPLIVSVGRGPTWFDVH